MCKLKRRLQRLVRVYTCQNDKLLEISCRGSFHFRYASQYETVSRHNPFHEKILYASVIIVMIAIVSIIHCLGTLFPYFLEEFGESRAKTAAVQSTFISVGLCSGKFLSLSFSLSLSLSLSACTWSRVRMCLLHSDFIDS